MTPEFQEIMDKQLQDLDIPSLDKLMGIGNELGLPITALNQ